MDMPGNIDNMTMKEVKDWVAKEQEKIDLKKQAVQKLCWDEIGEVCKKYNCRVKPVVRLNEMEDGYYTFYADLVVVAQEIPDEQSASESDGGSKEGVEGMDEKLDSKENDERGNGDNESAGEENNEVREG